MNSILPPTTTDGPIACSLTDPDGALLGGGVVHACHVEHGEQRIVLQLPRPGLILDRCLVGSLRSLLISFGDGPPLVTELDRIFFDRRLGRVCILRVAQAPLGEDAFSAAGGTALPGATARAVLAGLAGASERPAPAPW